MATPTLLLVLVFLAVSKASGSEPRGLYFASPPDLNITEHSLHKRQAQGSCGFPTVPNSKCSPDSTCFTHTDGVCRCRGQYELPQCKGLCPNGRYLDFDYRLIHPYHSASRSANPSCTIYSRGNIPSEKNQILRLHNEYRERTAKGNSRLPTGSNIKELKWNDELAYIAQKWADQCHFNHDDNGANSPCSKKYSDAGQNIASINRHHTDMQYKNFWDIAMRDMYNEYSEITHYKSNQYIKPSGFNHYTQIVWAETYEVGCGAVTYANGGATTSLYVCNYGPAGNLKGGAMYKIGSPASACGSSGQSRKYPGLCATQ